MRKGFGKKFVAGLLLATLTVSSLSACGKKEDAKGEYSLIVGESGDAALNNPLIQLAEEEGYFEDYGLTLEHVKLENTGAVMYDALSVGRIETAYAQLVPPISYGAQGFDVTMIGGVLSGGMVAVVLPENYDELKDLNNWKGHSIGVIQMSTSEASTRYVLQSQYGLNTDDDLTYVMIEDYPSISLGVAKGNVDIGFIGSQYVEGALDQGLVVLTTLDDIFPNYVCCRQSAYTQNLEENRDAYVAYLKAQIKAYKVINTDQDKTIESLTAASGESDDYVYDYVYDYEASGHRTYNPDPNYNGTDAVYQILLERGYVESDLNLSEFYDLSVYADALKAVIEEEPDESFYKDMWVTFQEQNNTYPNFDSLYGDSFLSLDDYTTEYVAGN